jgi:SWI/SNF-related matrix-associated actin-dependent regulator of chromatin subfamily A-like protein 1
MKSAYIVNGKYIRVCFPQSNGGLNKELREIPKVHYGDSYFDIPLSVMNAKKLSELDFVFSKEMRDWYKGKTTRVQSKIESAGGTLYPYQYEGVNFIENRGGRALIADEMGLGKTIQALAWLHIHSDDAGPAVIICPSSLKVNWQREANKWAPKWDVEIVQGQTPYELDGNLIIINYDILPYWLRRLSRMHVQTLVVDESHYIKNSGAKRTKAFKRLNKNVRNVIALTGTPIENKPIEIFNIAQAIDPSVFPNYITFIKKYCDAKKDRYGWNVDGASNMYELNHILKNTVMIRRKKKDVLKDLPPKRFVKVTLEIDNRLEYMEAEDEFIRYLDQQFTDLEITDEVKAELKQYAKSHDIEVSDELTDEDVEAIKNVRIESAQNSPIFTRIEVLKQLAVAGKMKQIIDWIEDFLESGEKLVVFAIHRKVIRELMEKFPNAVKIDGSVSMVKRQKAVDSFQSDPKVQLLIGNIRAAGVGITLTAASNAAIIQFPWTPGELVQASDRIHRISQTKKVTVYNMVGEDTIEEKIIDALIKKEKIISQILDGYWHEDESILTELLKSYEKK